MHRIPQQTITCFFLQWDTYTRYNIHTIQGQSALSLINLKIFNPPDKIFCNNLDHNQTWVDRDKPRNLEFGLCFIDFGLLLWTRNESGLPIGPHTITKSRKKAILNQIWRTYWLHKKQERRGAVLPPLFTTWSLSTPHPGTGDRSHQEWRSLHNSSTRT